MAELDHFVQTEAYKELARTGNTKLPRRWVHSRTTGELLELNPLEQCFLSRCVAGMDPKDAEKHVIDKFGTSDSRSFTRRLAREAWDQLAQHGLVKRADDAGREARVAVKEHPELSRLVPTTK